MGIKNYLIDGVSCAGKTSVCDELQRRGYHAIHGDRELAYQGDPRTGEPTDGRSHEHHVWHVDRVRALVADPNEPVTFFCGGSRNYPKFMELFDGVFILDVDLDTLNERIDQRVLADPGGWEGQPEERALVERLHRTKEQVPEGTVIDATPPLTQVADEILRRVGVAS